MAYRFVICVDVDADSLEMAYSKLTDFMAPTARAASDDINWESSDESYDDDGDPIDPDVMQTARMKVSADGNTGQEQR